VTGLKQSERYPVQAGRLLGGYGLVSILLAGELLLPGRSLYRWDTLLYNWPLIVEARAQILSGYLPFWADSICCGTPLLENINAGLLYPLRAICWFLPLKLGYHLFLFGHVWLSLVGMHLFVRRGLRLGGLAAFAGALAYAGSGYARAMWDTHNFMALPWIPLGLLALLGARQPKSALPAVLGGAACWAMLILGGDFQAAVCWVPVAGFLAVVCPERRRLVPVLLATVALGALLSAPQWVPTAFASQASYRVGGLPFSEATERSFHPLRLLEWLVPHAYGSRDLWLGKSLAGAGATRVLPWCTSTHIGVLLLLAAVVGARNIRRPFVKWALVLLLISVALSLGRFLPGYGYWHALPGFRHFRYPEKYLLWSTFALSVLAAQGVPALTALCRSGMAALARRRMLVVWTVVLAAGCGLVVLVVRQVSAEESLATMRWMAVRGSSVALVVGAVWVAAYSGLRHRWRVVLPLLLLLDVALAWYVERPTTARFNPLATPAAAAAIRNSEAPFERFLRDRAVKRMPMASHPAPRRSEAEAIFHRARLAYNSPRLWGLYTADGFSPIEAAAMRARRLEQVAPDDDSVPGVEPLIAFCRAAAVRWLVTTEERLRQLKDAFRFTIHRRWDDRALLVRLDETKPAYLVAEAGASPGQPLPEVLQVWRMRPGRMRVDLRPGMASQLVVSESYGRGWRAWDAVGEELAVAPADDAFLGVQVPPGTTQVRLAYTPPGWRVGAGVGAAGFMLFLVLLGNVNGRRLAAWCTSPAGMAVLAGFLFLSLGLLARGHWACTFDEGFHVTRGTVRAVTGDARLSFFHPPLQNLACGYFGELAHGDRLYLPQTLAWQEADLFTYSTELALTNRDLFPGLVRASRWGTLFFGLLLCVVGVRWAYEAAGPWAGALAGIGLALNPNILTHGHLATTDMGVTATALAGSYALWRYVRRSKALRLATAGFFFACAALVKYTGLIWLGVYLLIGVPALAWWRRSPRVLGHLPLTAAIFLGGLWWLYGSAPYLVRLGDAGWPSGESWWAGRYVEGLFLQAGHALEGQRAFFLGRQFTAGRWWYLPVALLLKTPAVWAVAAVAATAWFCARRRSAAAWVPWLPGLAFLLLLLVANKLAIGVRHALPLLALALVGASVCVARWRWGRLRAIAVVAIMGTSILTAAVVYPNYPSYMTPWSGGVADGHNHLVDSNYDWGQELDQLERHWAALTDANGGRPPHLIYFGFVDPRIVYRMPAANPSLGGHMGRALHTLSGERESTSRQATLEYPNDAVVISVSALKLDPYGFDFSKLRARKPIGRIGHTFFVFAGDHE